MEITLDVGGSVMALADKFNFCDGCEMQIDTDVDGFSCLAIDTNDERKCIRRTEVVDEAKYLILQRIPSDVFE